MTTEEMVDELVQRFNGWNRAGDHGVLRYLNSAHNILRAVDSQQTTILDTATGLLPVLNTTAGVYQYTMPSNVRRVSAIGLKIGPIGDSFNILDYGMSTQQGRTSYKNCIVVAGVQYSKVPYARCFDRVNDSTLARVVFSVDPETNTDYYYRLSFFHPTQILSESIQPDIASPYDFDYLVPAAAKLIEGVQSGNYDEARRIVRNEIKPAYWKELNEGEQGDLDTESVDRGF